MRKTLLFISFVWLSIFALAQTPQAFKYQTVARNTAGEILASQNITFRMTILQGALPGTVVYAETHLATTNTSGLATLEIGRGTPVTGNFAAINWSTTPIFLKTEIDPAGGSAYVEMGTSELLSVPYALYAENTANNDDADADPANELQTVTQNGLNVSLSQGGGTITVADNDNNPSNELQTLSKAGNVVSLSQNGGSFVDEVNDADADPTNEIQYLSKIQNTLSLSGGGEVLVGVLSYTQPEIDALSPYNGLTVHNATTNCINYYFMNNWFEACGTCTPQPSQAYAGDDQYYSDATTSVTLEANTPANGTGLWTIVSGEGGVFEDATNPISEFTGQACQSYGLMWSITTSCGSSTDNVNIAFNYQPTAADAGPDQIGIGGSTTTLAGNTPADGTGLWTVLTGEGGSFGEPTSPTSTFTGVPTTDYTLNWTISTPCASLSDNVSIRFWSCGLPLAVNHVSTDGVSPVNKSVSYGTVTNIPGATSKCWITSNLGADHQATSVDDATEASAGWYWQFNRKQGYKHDGTTRTPNTVWISSISETSDWTPANDPCTLELGAGWRIPTNTEWTAVDASGNWSNWNGPWNSGLKMHAAGYLYFGDGSFYDRGSYGHYWSSKQYSVTNGLYLSFSSSYSYVYYDYHRKATGFSLRCIRD